SVFQGKGLGLQQAYASALMEAAEFYHAEDLDSRFLLTSYKKLARTAALVDPADLCGNGRRFDRSRPIEWIEGYDLLQHEPCWLPAEIVHTDMVRAQTYDSGCFLRGSNGLASGNNLAEALSAAICEVVERDAVALWGARDLRDRAGCHLNPESIDNVAARDLLARYARAGIGVRIWNVTSDVGMPTFVCHIREDSDDPNLGMRRFHGAGCHPDRGIALIRALTEAAQTRLAYINGARDDLPFEHYSAPDNAETAEALLDALEAARAPSEFADLPHYDAADVGEDVRWELHRLSSIGIKRVVAVDLTREELGVPVVRVVIPGLEGDNRNPEYVPGRRSQPLHARVGKWCWRRTRYIAGAPPTVSAPSADELAAPVIATFGNPVAVIFAGPSLPPSARPDDPRLVWRPPARSGDVYRAALERPAAIGLIDGYFDAVPSVRHKEILWAIEQGIRVYGASSMGALRAAELAAFGMIGVGRVFTMYCDGTLADDDEVAVAHGPEDTGYLQMTEPMVNVRATMEAAMRAGVIGADLAGHITASAKALHHSVRTLPAILSRAAESGAVRQPLAVLHDRLRGARVDQKRLDAHRMVDEIRDMLVPASVTCESAHVSLRAKRSNLAPALLARECFVPPRFARDPRNG
ncbi:MAG TPA: YcaO-like family protein, partial [Acetobacteraceae bacterium]|nr:YcaO-like family protein [Acetobacteraceae bacterium]